MASRKGGGSGRDKKKGPSRLTTTPQRRFQCSDCDESFSDRRLLASHRDVFHLRMRQGAKKPSLSGRNKMGVRQAEKGGKRAVPRINANGKKKDAKMTKIGVTIPSSSKATVKGTRSKATVKGTRSKATVKGTRSREQVDSATTEAGVTFKLSNLSLKSAPPAVEIAEPKKDTTVQIEFIAPSSDERDSAHDLVADRPGSEDGKQMKSLECPVCNATFTNRWNLTRHVRKNHKSDPLISKISVKCSECPATFLSRLELINHKRESHALEAFTCSVCSKQFSVKANLLFHQTSQHFPTNSVLQKSPNESNEMNQDPGNSSLPSLPVAPSSCPPGSEQERAHVADLNRYRDEIRKTCQEFNQRRIAKTNSSFFLTMGRYDPTNT